MRTFVFKFLCVTRFPGPRGSTCAYFHVAWSVPTHDPCYEAYEGLAEERETTCQIATPSARDSQCDVALEGVAVCRGRRNDGRKNDKDARFAC